MPLLRQWLERHLSSVKGKLAELALKDLVATRGHSLGDKPIVILKTAENPEVKAAVEKLLGKERSRGKAPHGNSSDEDDECLTARLQQVSVTVTLTHRQEAPSRSEPRSDVAAVDEAEKWSTVVFSRPPPADQGTEGRVSGTPMKIRMLG